MSEVYYTINDVKGWVHNIIRAMNNDGWRPDYIVGLNRGGLVPAVLLSHYLDITLHTLNVSLRDFSVNSSGPESNLWMAEDAFGYVPHEDTGLTVSADRIVSNPAFRKNILIVDDINDSGATLNWIKEDWAAGCLPNESAVWDNVWGDNVRFATLINNEASSFKNINYVGKYINKVENDEWCVFPWEEWWR